MSYSAGGVAGAAQNIYSFDGKRIRPRLRRPRPELPDESFDARTAIPRSATTPVRV